jgi:hypothetical protein
LFNLALRQAMGMAQSLLKLAGLDWQLPDFSTVSRCQKHLSVTVGAQPPAMGLHLLVDSTGIKMMGEGVWKTKKHGADYRRQWRKVHLGIDATLEIRAIDVPDNATGDAPILPCLLDQIPAGEAVASVSGDGAYDTKGCHEATAQRGAQAISLRTALSWIYRSQGANITLIPPSGIPVSRSPPLYRSNAAQRWQAGIDPGCVKRKKNRRTKKSTSQNGLYAIFSGSGGVTLPIKILSFCVFTQPGPIAGV